MKKFIDIFKDGLEKTDAFSHLLQFEKIDEVLLPKIGDKKLLDKEKENILEFGKWYMNKYGKNLTIMTQIIENGRTNFPLILLIYHDLIEDTSFLGQDVKWNTYIKMFQDGLEDSVESIISRLAYVNAYFTKRFEECDILDYDPKEPDFEDRNRDAVIIFHDWFNAILGENDEVSDTLFNCWNAMPNIFEYVESIFEEMDDMEEDVDYDDLAFSDKKNVDSLMSYMWDFKEDRQIFFVDEDGDSSEPFCIPGDIDDKDEETVEAIEFLHEFVRNYLASITVSQGAVIFSHCPNEKTVVFNGFLCMDGKFSCMDKEQLEIALNLSFKENTDIPNIIYEEADVLFI